MLTVDDPLLVNALQRRAAVVLQKSTREGFGLTVTEAMWKGAAVVGGNVGGIRHQIRDGENGFLVDTVDQAADRIVQLLRDPGLRKRIGAQAQRDGAREVPHEPPAGRLARSAGRLPATVAATAMRIAQIAPLAESVPPKLYGGTERVVAWLIDELVALGHDVTLFASGDSQTRAKLVPVWPYAFVSAGRGPTRSPCRPCCSKRWRGAPPSSTSSTATSTGCPAAA